jgi:pseudouridine synthase
MSTRLNKFIANNTTISRRKADDLISSGKVSINGQVAVIGQAVEDSDRVSIYGKDIERSRSECVPILVMVNKPVGYVSSPDGQGSRSVYDLLPNEYVNLKIAGRLDKNSSGLMLFSDSGDLINQLTHPSFGKNKVYQVRIGRPLDRKDKEAIETGKVVLEDGISKLKLESIEVNPTRWQITMQEGRNRQIRRTFAQLDYDVIVLHRIKIADYELGDLELGEHRQIAVK